MTASPPPSDASGPTDNSGRSARFDLAAEYDAHGAALFGYAINALRDRPLAEDCVQETFLRAWRARDRFDPDRGGARTWLFAIQRNVILDVQRAQQRVPRLVPGDEVEDAPAETVDTLDRLVIVEALAKLSHEHRSAFVAIHIDGSTYAEASASSGVPVGTLRSRVFYALRALRSHIDGEESRA
ncbi:sigma-70 family RNA polymerase sigma factor [Herbiconiux sp. P15]|uniref:sigma-70 family RNA polymerase sigma factor n=1 Tax=Herbiconiux liukaitaii TaxID=3342799 RepID=UPI0035B8431A